MMTKATRQAVTKMATTETINGRIRVARDTTDNWNAHPDIIPMKGEIIVYTDYAHTTDDFGNNVDIPNVKIGDGSAYLVDLPFLGADARYETLCLINAHAQNDDIHVSLAEKAFWNNKLNGYVDNGNLVLNRM